ncbi:MAG: hypothetical protein V1837_06745 [Candidatus Woesearchaeota archaeon]
MKLTIDLEKDNQEDLEIVCELIKKRIPDLTAHAILKDNLTRDERIILAVINNLITKVGLTVPITDIVNDSKSLNFSQKKVNHVIEGLEKKGEICEIKQGFIAKTVA